MSIIAALKEQYNMCMSTRYACLNLNYPVYHGKYWTGSERRTARVMYARGASFVSIARKLNRTTTSVRYQILGE